MSKEIAVVPGKELAVIPDTRPWQERAWDTSGCPDWDQNMLHALKNSDEVALQSLVRMAEWSDPEQAVPPVRRHAHARVFYFDPEVVEAYLRRRSQ